MSRVDEPLNPTEAHMLQPWVGLTSYGINPQGGQMLPCDEELGETLTVCHMSGVVVEGMSLLWPCDCIGTLCARDGFKTGPRTPNGQDAFDKKLIVQGRAI